MLVMMDFLRQIIDMDVVDMKRFSSLCCCQYFCNTEETQLISLLLQNITVYRSDEYSAAETHISSIALHAI